MFGGVFLLIVRVALLTIEASFPWENASKHLNGLHAKKKKKKTKLTTSKKAPTVRRSFSLDVVDNDEDDGNDDSDDDNTNDEDDNARANIGKPQGGMNYRP